VFENRVLRKIFGPKRGKVMGGWRKLRNQEIYSSPDVIRMIKSRRMRWAGHIADRGEEEYIQGFGGKSRRIEATRKI
jgi:hypothetical protein